MTLAIETHHLTRFFDNFCAVKGVELAVERGTFYGFLGPNGAGKSTTMKMLTGLLAPSGGEMRVLGRNMLDPREALDAKRRMGVIPEDLALFDNLTARSISPSSAASISCRGKRSAAGAKSCSRSWTFRTKRRSSHSNIRTE